MTRLKLLLLGVGAVFVFSGCELIEGSSSEPPPQPQPPAEVVSAKDPNPTSDRLIFSSGADEPDLELYATFRDGSGRKRITSNTSGDSGATAYPDSGLVYYVCGRSESVCVGTTSGTGTAAVMSGQRIGFPIIEDPAISPDGSKMLFTGVHISPDGQSTNYDMYLYDFNTEEIQNFAVGKAQDQMGAWISDTQLVWSREKGTDWELVTFKLGSPAGSAPVTLTDNEFDDLGVDASEDGSKLSWIRIAGGAGEVVSMPFTGSLGTPTVLAPVRLERGFIGGDPDTVWSPSGDAVAFAGIPSSEADVEILTVPAGGGAVNNVTSNDIYDVDPEWALIPPSFSVSAPSAYTEGSSSPLKFVIQLDAPQTQTLSINYQTVNGSATAGSDYVAKSGTATFAPGQTRVEVNVTVTDDQLLEPLETVALRLSNSSAGTLTANEEATARIKDNEVEPTPTPPSPTPSPTVTSSPSPAQEVIAYQANGIWRVSPSGGAPQQLATGGSSPDIHPDGKSVLYYNGSPADLFTVPVAGGTPTLLKSTTDSDQTPAWTPDGAGVAWTRVSNSTGAIEVWISDPVTAEPTLLAPEATWPDGGTLADGTEVVAVVEAFFSSDPQIVFYNADTKARIGAVATGTTPAISPDGTKLAYSDDLHGDPDLFVLTLGAPLGANNPLHLTTNSATEWQPTWSPDGKKLAFATNRTAGNLYDIYVMDAGIPNSEKVLVATSADEKEPSWGGGVSTAAALPDASSSVEPVPSQSPTPAPDESPSPTPSPSALIVPAGSLIVLAQLGRRFRRR